jgi:hypothetical protein
MRWIRFDQADQSRRPLFQAVDWKSPASQLRAADLLRVIRINANINANNAQGTSYTGE